ncbi:MAG: hypothetical protein IMW90_09545 [Thermogemmatispora sp.]|jgi:hypothetical protein|uniref:hypothetical protein n=1 Tax=Thermogemmatispora sp. TaxID=1968838 RepID=UPI001A0683C9|nr:hypothetical protein [Thermogemmatispora sp.]MBE3565958.1 hypothetical protein [Thermogemmatispora sp.]
MPFFEEFEADVLPEETLRRPIWGAFALLRDQLERLVALNVGWAVQLVPALVALAWPALPLALRLPLVLYSALALMPATAVLFSGVARLNRQEPLDLATVREELGRLLLPSLRTLAPLPGLCGLLCLLIVVVGPLQLLPLDVLLRLLLLILGFSAVYWGPLFLAEPGQGAWSLLWQALRLAWRYPLPTAGSLLLALAVMLVGYLSIAGFFLIAPVLAALLLWRRALVLLARRGELKVGVP